MIRSQTSFKENHNLKSFMSHLNLFNMIEHLDTRRTTNYQRRITFYRLEYDSRNGCSLLRRRQVSLRYHSHYTKPIVATIILTWCWRTSVGAWMEQRNYNHQLHDRRLRDVLQFLNFNEVDYFLKKQVTHQSDIVDFDFRLFEFRN